MSSLVPDHYRRRDGRRKRKQPVEPLVTDAESGVEDLEDPYSHPRASHHPKKCQTPPKPQKSTGHITFEIHGDVTIKRDLNLGPGRRENRRRQPSPPSTRGSTHSLQSAKSRRSTMQCDSSTDVSTDSDEELSSCSEDNASHNVASRQPKRSMISAERPPVNSDRRVKRYQADEGYHTGGTASYTTEVNKQSGKGKERSLPSGPGGNSSRHARLSSSAKHRKPKATDSETDATSYTDSDQNIKGSDEDDNGVDEDDEDEDPSDDDFGTLPIQIRGVDPQDTKAIDEKAVLDTGTKPDWISQTFYDKLRKMGIKSVKLNPEEQKKYRDFNGKQFSPKSKVDLMIQSEEFKSAIKCRILSFFIASNAAFSILIGRDTIRKQELMTRGKRDTDGEEVLVGVHGESPEAEKAEIKRKRKEKNKIAQERKKQREAKIEETVREKSNVKTSSNEVAAHLATTVSRSNRSLLPQRSAKDAPKQLERQSDSSESSLEGTW